MKTLVNILNISLLFSFTVVIIIGCKDVGQIENKVYAMTEFHKSPTSGQTEDNTYPITEVHKKPTWNLFWYLDLTKSIDTKALEEAVKTMIEGLPVLVEELPVKELHLLDFGEDGWKAKSIIPPIKFPSLPTPQLVEQEPSELQIFGPVYKELQKKKVAEEKARTAPLENAFRADVRKRVEAIPLQKLLTQCDDTVTDLQGVLERVIASSDNTTISVLFTDAVDTRSKMLRQVSSNGQVNLLIILLPSTEKHDPDPGSVQFKKREKLLRAIVPQAVVAQHFILNKQLREKIMHFQKEKQNQ